ncbi:hypothetical protein [Bacillus sp. EAC]|uniref:hypothetical protein n=1 Tax=Bacillus sp. EAC TaxID=1978338 RepID=UPI0015C4F891|nr:hypothetical protein [Bacillus sp. EAC]
MEKKPLYYDGSGHDLKFIPVLKSQQSIEIKDEQRKNLGANPYVIDWNLVKKL